MKRQPQDIFYGDGQAMVGPQGAPSFYTEAVEAINPCWDGCLLTAVVGPAAAGTIVGFQPSLDSGLYAIRISASASGVGGNNYALRAEASPDNVVYEPIGLLGIGFTSNDRFDVLCQLRRDRSGAFGAAIRVASIPAIAAGDTITTCIQFKRISR